MADNIEITDNSTRSIAFFNPLYKTETLTFDAADTYAKGTLLARRAVAEAVTVTDGTNTGDGTCTLATVVTGDIIPVIGDYNLECTAVVTDGGTFKLEDPNGAIVATGLSVGAIVVAGLGFTLTDGATDFAVGDTFALTVAADGTMVAFATDGVGGAQIPKAILDYEVTADEAGTISISALISGRVRKGDLIIDADGDDTNIDDAVIDQMRDFMIIAQETTQLAETDNQ